MKTTIELPDSLMRDVKLRAVHEGRKLKDLMAELLQRGLEAPEIFREPASSYITTDEKTGLPIIVGGRTPPPEEQLTPDQIKDILLEQEVARYLDPC